MKLRPRNGYFLIQFALLIMVISLLSGCSFDLTGPTYTKDSMLAALKQVGITAHYPVQQGNGKLLNDATGTRYLLQIDSIDRYEVNDGWVEVYLYQDAEQAYKEATEARKTYDLHYHYDEKIASLQGKKLEKAPYPLFQHGNVIVFGAGIANDQEALQRVTEIFGQFKN